MDILDPFNLPDDLPDDERNEIEQEVKRTTALLQRLPSASTLAFCRQRMERYGETISDLEEKMSDIPAELERDCALGQIPDVGEDWNKYHRRVFIALNWRNN